MKIEQKTFSSTKNILNYLQLNSVLAYSDWFLCKVWFLCNVSNTLHPHSVKFCRHVLCFCFKDALSIIKSKVPTYSSPFA